MFSFETPALLTSGQTFTINCTVAPSSSPLDDKLYLLQKHLAQRLAELERPDGLLAASKMVIDLGVLGTKDHVKAEDTIPSWKGCPVYPIRLERSQVILGPFFHPEQANVPCPHCLERRWFSMRPQIVQMAFIQAQQTLIPKTPVQMTPFVLDAIWHTLVSIFHTLATRPAAKQIASPFYVLDCETFLISRHDLLQDSDCPFCAPVQLDSAENAIIRLQERLKPEISAYRLIKAADYPFSLSSLANPIGGMLGDMGLPELMNTLTAPVTGRFTPRNDALVYEVWWSGHGNSYDQSLYLGILEGIERHAGIAPHGKQIHIVDSYENLKSDALDPRECGVYSDEFYRRNTTTFLPFAADRPMAWIWGYSFREERPILVPEQIVYYMSQRNNHVRFVHDSSSGCATGSCMEEAILYGLLELIERDAFLLTWYAQLAPNYIDPRSSKRAETLFTLERIEQQGYDLYLFDTRMDVRIPSITGIARRKEPGLGNIIVAAGSGMDPEDAMQSALCEVASYISNVTLRIEGQLELLHEMVDDYSKVTTLTHHATLYALPKMGSRLDFLFQNQPIYSVAEAYVDWQEAYTRTYDLRDDLVFCIEHIKQLGMDVIVVDQTSPEQALSGLKTVCVIVPGLLPIDFGWGRDRVLTLPRLRTIPRVMGFRETDFEPDSNAVIPHPFP